MMVTAAQIRAARVLRGLSQAELAAKAGVSVPTLKRCESELDSAAPVTDATRAKVVSALETSGIVFIEPNGEGPGVRLRKGFD